MTTTRQLTTFWLRGFWMGVDVAKVQEVIRWQPLTRVPTAPPVVAGLMNLRGQIVTALDLRRRLELDGARCTADPFNIVVHGEERMVSLLVDEIGDVIEVDEALYEAAPPTLHGVARELIRGAYKLADRLLLVLDVDRTVSGWADTARNGANQGSNR